MSERSGLNVALEFPWEWRSPFCLGSRALQMDLVSEPAASARRLGSFRSGAPWEARGDVPADLRFPHYVFLFLKRKEGLTDDEYRNLRANLLSDYCRVTKLKFPEATDIIGIASEAGLPPQRSEDLMYLDASHWSPADEAKAKEIQGRFGLLRNVKSERTREYEYPVDHNSRPRKRAPSRNSPCPCGSGQRFKRCHGKGLFDKKRGDSSQEYSGPRKPSSDLLNQTESCKD